MQQASGLQLARIAIITMLVIGVGQFLEGNILTPKLVGDSALISMILATDIEILPSSHARIRV